MTKRGQKLVRINMSTQAKREYLKDEFVHGFISIDILTDDRLAMAYFADDKTYKNGKVDYYNGSSYEIFREAHWKKFCEEIAEYVKSQTEKEVIDHI